MERYHYGTISCMILVLYFLYCKLAHIMFIFRERRNQDYTLWKPHQNTVWEPANLTYIWPPESKTSLRPNWWNWNVLTSRCILAIVSLSRDVSEPRTEVSCFTTSKWFNLSPHDHIYIVKYIFGSRDDTFKNKAETTVLWCSLPVSVLTRKRHMLKPSINLEPRVDLWWSNSKLTLIKPVLPKLTMSYSACTGEPYWSNDSGDITPSVETWRRDSSLSFMFDAAAMQTHRQTNNFKRREYYGHFELRYVQGKVTWKT